MAAIAAALFASGCGGGGASSPGTAASPLSHDQLVKQADAICRTYTHRASEEFRDVKDDAAAAALWDQHLAQFDRLVADLGKLQPSDGDSAAYAAWLEAGEKQRPLIVAAKPPTTNEAMGKLVLEVARVNGMAAAIGMDDCAIDVDRTETPMTKARYIELADGLCAGTQAALSQVAVPETLPDFDQAMGKMMPVITMLQRDLRAIPAPDGDGDRLGAWLSSRDIIVQDIQAMWDAAKKDDATGFQQASQAVMLGDKAAGRMAQAYGIDCGTT
jgi:hypothetical protein